MIFSIYKYLELLENGEDLLCPGDDLLHGLLADPADGARVHLLAQGFCPRSFSNSNKWFGFAHVQSTSGSRLKFQCRSGFSFIFLSGAVSRP